jgi:hypothetical protein
VIVCDHEGCTARCRQPVPHGWSTVYDYERREYFQFCPAHADQHRPAPAPRRPLRGGSSVSDGASRVDDIAPPAPMSSTANLTPCGKSLISLAASPRLVEPAPGVELYDRPPLPRALRESAEDGWRVGGWGSV